MFFHDRIITLPSLLCLARSILQFEIIFFLSMDFHFKSLCLTLVEDQEVDFLVELLSLYPRGFIVFRSLSFPSGYCYSSFLP